MEIERLRYELHKKSMLYYPEDIGLAESTNKMLQNIRKKIINDNTTDWDPKLHNALWVHHTNFNTNIQ